MAPRRQLISAPAKSIEHWTVPDMYAMERQYTLPYAEAKRSHHELEADLIGTGYKCSCLSHTDEHAVPQMLEACRRSYHGRAAGTEGSTRSASEFWKGEERFSSSWAPPLLVGDQ